MPYQVGPRVPLVCGEGQVSRRGILKADRVVDDATWHVEEIARTEHDVEHAFADDLVGEIGRWPRRQRVAIERRVQLPSLASLGLQDEDLHVVVVWREALAAGRCVVHRAAAQAPELRLHRRQQRPQPVDPMLRLEELDGMVSLEAEDIAALDAQDSQLPAFAEAV